MCNNDIDINWLKEILQNKPLIEKLKKIKLIISDIDGCLANGKVYGEEESKGFCVQDGFGTVKALEAGLKIAFITGKNSNQTKERAKTLGIPDELCHVGICNDKIEKVHDVQEKTSCSKEETLFFGDDVLDIEAKEAVGVFASPKNLIFYLKPYVDFIIPREGGKGAFRLLLDLILYSQGKHFAADMIEESLKK